jgi:hypothetical protein
VSLGIALVLSLQVQGSPYADSATAALIARARERHRQQDAAIHDYRATLRTRLDAELGRGGFARFLPIAVEEQEAELAWQAPNDVKVVTLGRRYRTVFRNAEINSSWTRPWFVPRFLGDSIRLLSGEDFPDRAAVHPLSSGADAYYRYAIRDSVTLFLPGRTVRAVGVHVTPTRADASLIAGELWLDEETAETVRLSFVFIGKRLWVDSIGPTPRDTARADRNDALAQRILRVSADLEYGLYDQHFWLPYRQAVTLDIQLPWFKNLVVPVHFITTFSGVRVNENPPISFTALPPDTTRRGTRRRRGDVTRRCGPTVTMGAPAEDEDAGQKDAQRQGCVTVGTWPGGRYEVDVPADSTLLSYKGWTDSLQFDLSAADAERLSALREDVLNSLERLPDSLTGRPRLALAFDRLTDVWRYNRAEGTSFGAGYEWRPGPPFVSLMAKGRYAFTDGRLQGSLTLRRDAPTSRLEATAFREMRDADPLAPGLTFSNSFDAFWFARDDGDYVFAQGAEFRYQRPLGRLADLTLQARYGEESAPRRLAHDGLNDLLGGDGRFPPNGPVLAGSYWVAGAEVGGGARPFSWRAGAEGTAGTRAHARGWVSATARFRPAPSLDLTASGWVGAGAGDSLPQRQFRLGGSKTLRGYPAGSLRGVSAWAFGLDVGLARRTIAPVVFADAGQVAPRAVRFAGQPAFSLGAGVSVLDGLLRLDAARPVAPRASWIVRLLIGARR